MAQCSKRGAAPADSATSDEPDLPRQSPFRSLFKWSASTEGRDFARAFPDERRRLLPLCGFERYGFVEHAVHPSGEHRKEE